MSDRQFQGGRGRGRSGQYNRQGGRGRGGNRNHNNNYLKGACEELKDNVYTVGDAKQADRYSKTTESIVNYIQRNYDDGQEVKDALVKLQNADMEEYRPDDNDVDEDEISYVEKMILQEKVKEYMK